MSIGNDGYYALRSPTAGGYAIAFSHHFNARSPKSAIFNSECLLPLLDRAYIQSSQLKNHLIKSI
ncbi:hypothetical protein [Anabaena sp. CCY 9402-a]|uniref:hypothetical protein n=1 Tax=Anabaena sp. CCY 9402-a TaxID=3103867 RepID=UPI0039C6197E